MRNFNWQSGLILFAATISFGCGSDSNGNGGSAQCTAVTGCGGDITGTWTIASVCLNEPDSTLTETCGAVNMHIGSATATGTLTFNADGTQSQNFTAVIEDTLIFPTSCVANATVCTQSEAAVNAQAGASDGHCTFSSAGCTCTFKVTQTNTDGGNYQVSGTSVTFQNTGEDPETDPYCVSGNKLSLQTSDGDGNPITVSATK